MIRLMVIKVQLDYDHRSKILMISEDFFNIFTQFTILFKMNIYNMIVILV